MQPAVTVAEVEIIKYVMRSLTVVLVCSLVFSTLFLKDSLGTNKKQIEG